MASKNFAINVKPHVATIGDVELLFTPEANGAEFADAYAELKDAQALASESGDNVTPADLKAINTAMRGFIRSFLLDESKTVFDETALPDRILVQLLEWVAELYGSGSGNDQPGSSGAS